MSEKRLSTVRLDSDKCKGCINCMKRCPTEAIRVRDGKAFVDYDRCIGCGECVRICVNRAKRATYDNLDVIDSFPYKVALPSPSLYGQFNNLDDINIVLTALKRIGFDDVYEVARAAEVVSDLTRKMMDEHCLQRPIISSACPAIVELILIRFHTLKGNLLPLLAPVDVAAKCAREEAIEKTGLRPEEIGVFFISPCPAKVFALKSGMGLNKPVVDGVLAQSEVYFKLISEMPKIKEPEPLAKIGVVGLSWPASGGESSALFKEKYLAADGIENVITVLKELEDGKLDDLDFIELNACPGGCVGGVLNIENPFVARSKLQALRKYKPISKSQFDPFEHGDDFYKWECIPQLQTVLTLDEDRFVAMQKLKQIGEICKQLPSLDCGLCGAPTCRALAEDIVSGKADISQCMRKERLDKLRK